MDKDIIKVLVIDDDEDDFYLINDYLSDVYESQYAIEWASSYDIGTKLINEKSHDIYLFDYRLGEHTGIELLNYVIKQGYKTPVILLTGNKDHHIDMEAMRLGAYDYLIKSQITPSMLERSIRYALERKKMEDELFQEKERAIITFESIGDTVITTDLTGRVTNVNLVGEKMLGWKRTDIIGMDFSSIVKLINENSREFLPNILYNVLEREHIVSLPEHTMLINRNSKEYAVEGTASPIHNREHRVIGAVVVLHDVTRNRELTKKLYHQARHDALTGLPNRYNFEEELWQAFYDVKKFCEEHALLYLDLDQFKIINDTCGHFAGDQFLKQLSALIKKAIRDTDHIARLGGDEFGILLKHISEKNAIKIAEKICQMVQGFRFTWKDKLFSAGVSIGIVVLDHTQNAFDCLLSSADRACYVAKEKGGSTYHLFEENDIELAERHGEMQWMSRLSRAFEDERFELYYQPIAPVGTDDSRRSFEVLIRLIDEKGRVISLGAFLPAAQRYNMMPSIDRWVIYKFLTNFQRIWNLFGDEKPARFNINLSGTSLNNENILNMIRDELKKNKIPPEMICFEITETIAISNFNGANAFIKQLRELGCKFAIDDFGSGLTSFEYLKHLPVDYLKIDGSFIKNITSSPVDYAMVSSIHSIAQLMGMKTVAEFVENEDIFQCLLEIGIDYAQGYWIDKPMPLEDVLASKKVNTAN